MPYGATLRSAQSRRAAAPSRVTFRARSDATPRRKNAEVPNYRRIRRYTGLAMLLHWQVTAGIAFLFVHSFYMMDIPAP